LRAGQHAAVAAADDVAVVGEVDDRGAGGGAADDDLHGDLAVAGVVFDGELAGREAGAGFDEVERVDAVDGAAELGVGGGFAGEEGEGEEREEGQAWEGERGAGGHR
jgi:hypothetical protein